MSSAIKMTRIDDILKTKFAHVKHRMATNIIYTGTWMTGQFDQITKQFGISRQQFNILRILRGAKDWVNMNEVKNRMIEKSPNATRLCDKLLDKELIERQRCDEDRRVVHLKISEKGLELLAEVDVITQGNNMKYLENITDEEAVMISDILDRMRG